MAESRPKNRFERTAAWRRAALIGGTCVAVSMILFALAEGAVRLRAWHKHGQSVIRIEDLYRYDERFDLRLPKPGFTSSRLTINSLGFRGPEIPRVKPKGIYRIAFLGGSTTFCAEASSDDQTWPHLVVEALEAAHPGLQFDYVNAGVPGFTTRESLKRYELQVSALNADLVVIYHASNDLTRNSRQLARMQGLADDVGDRGLTWLSKWSMLIYLAEKNLTVLALQKNVNEPSNKLKTKPSMLAAPFEQDLRELVRSVKRSGSKVALVSFATRMRREQTQVEKKFAAVTSLYYMPYMTPNSLLDAFAAYNQIIRDVANEEGVIFIDVALAIPDDTLHFIDSIHFTDQGAAAMAKVVSARLVSAVR